MSTDNDNIQGLDYESDQEEEEDKILTFQLLIDDENAENPNGNNDEKSDEQSGVTKAKGLDDDNNTNDNNNKATLIKRISEEQLQFDDENNDPTDDEDENDNNKDATSNILEYNKNYVTMKCIGVYSISIQCASLSNFLVKLPSQEKNNKKIMINSIINSPLIIILNVPNDIIKTIANFSREIPSIFKQEPHTIELVIKYLEHHNGKKPKQMEKPIRSNKMEEIVDDIWDAQFIDGLSQDQLFEVISAANYLDIASLLDLSCAKVAAMIKGKTPEEIRTRFGIANDFSPEEEEAVRAENRWAED